MLLHVFLVPKRSIIIVALENSGEGDSTIPLPLATPPKKRCYTSVCNLSSYSRKMATLFQPKCCIRESLALLKADVDGTFVNNTWYLKLF